MSHHFKYDYLPAKNEILVSLLNENCEALYENIKSDLAATASRYHLQFIPYEDLEKQSRDMQNNYVIRHLMILVADDDALAVTQRYRPLLNYFHSMSIAIVYSSQEAMIRQEAVINELKGEFNDQVNYLRPDTRNGDQYLVSSTKILDNAVCDTIRIKYQPQQISADNPVLSEELKYFFTKASQLYTDFHLYHRSPTDGFFAVNTPEGIYVTCTKTHKSPLDLDRISLVTGYDEATNRLSYCGRYLPSSDVVEASIVFRHYPGLKAIVHTHASKLFTRNLSYAHKIKLPKCSYGIPEVGIGISAVIGDFLDDFIILEEHGEYFNSTCTPKMAVDNIEALLKRELLLEHAQVLESVI